MAELQPTSGVTWVRSRSSPPDGCQRRRRLCRQRGGDTIYGSGGPHRSLQGRAEASAGASVAVFDPLALFDVGISGIAGGDWDSIVRLPVVPSSGADSVSPPSASFLSSLLSSFLSSSRRRRRSHHHPPPSPPQPPPPAGAAADGRRPLGLWMPPPGRLPALRLCNSSDIVAQFRFI